MKTKEETTTQHAHTGVLATTDIPYVTADEAYRLLQSELERFLGLLETLKPDDWARPTVCTLWNIHDMVAHQAGGYATGTGYQELIRQYLGRPKKGQLTEDEINELQVRERASKSSAELIAELRQVGPVAIEKWAYQFRLVRPIIMPHPIGRFSLRHLMWVIHSRDTWMHRLDICRATQRDFQQTREHDGRIAALVMRDAGLGLSNKLNGRAVLFDLSGSAGGCWKVGAGEATATIAMDVLDFNIFASGRFTFQEARTRATLSGDVSLAESALRHVWVLY